MDANSGPTGFAASLILDNMSRVSQEIRLTQHLSSKPYPGFTNGLTMPVTDSLSP